MKIVLIVFLDYTLDYYWITIGLHTGLPQDYMRDYHWITYWIINVTCSLDIVWVTWACWLLSELCNSYKLWRVSYQYRGIDQKSVKRSVISTTSDFTESGLEPCIALSTSYSHTADIKAAKYTLNRNKYNIHKHRTSTSSCYSYIEKSIYICEDWGGHNSGQRHKRNNLG